MLGPVGKDDMKDKIDECRVQMWGGGGNTSYVYHKRVDSSRYPIELTVLLIGLL